MTTWLGKSCSFGLLCVSFVGVSQILFVPLFPFGIVGGMWDVIVLIPDYCLSIYFTYLQSNHYVSVKDHVQFAANL